MARIILCPGEKKQEGNIRSDVKYQYSNGWLTVWEDGKVILKQPLNKERAYVVCFTAGKVTLKKMYPPKLKVRVIAWLCGAALEAYCFSEEEYENKIRDYYASTDTCSISHEWDLKGDHYQMHWTQKKGEYAQPYSVACYIDACIPNEEVLKLVPTMLKAGFGKRYIQKILQDRFEITQKEFERVIGKLN